MSMHVNTIAVLIYTHLVYKTVHVFLVRIQGGLGSIFLRNSLANFALTFHSYFKQLRDNSSEIATGNDGKMGAINKTLEYLELDNNAV